MRCRSCRKEIPEGAVYCQHCGVKQSVRRLPKSRGNGQGSAYRLPNGKWRAAVLVGYRTDTEGKIHRRMRCKDGFKTKREALEYIPLLRARQEKPKSITLRELYDRWEPTHRAGKSTMGNYHAAWKYFLPLYDLPVADIDVDDLQDCLDDCPRGKRTKENMKALAGLLYKYGIPRRLTDMNLGEYLTVTAPSGEGKSGLPMAAVDKLRAAIGAVPCADYIVAQCYLGFRPSELLALRVEDYSAELRAFTGGSKTDAGRDRIVTVSPKIQPIIDRLVGARRAGLVFCMDDGSPMSIATYRDRFYAALEAVGIDNPIFERDGKQYHAFTPHSCRHTFATLMKGVHAPDKDKLELIGHTSTEMLRHYQDVNIEDLRRITNAL